MKLNQEMRFPHPVLWSGTNDYTQGEFRSDDWTVAERLDTGEVSVSGRLHLAQPAIESLLARGLARAGVLVSCLETYFSSIVETRLPDVSLHIPAGSVHGRVTLQPVVWASTALADLASPLLHDEYSGLVLPADRGAILAIADEAVVIVGREKLAPLETIFELAKRDDLSPGQFNIDLDGEKIGIVACASTFSQIHQLRSSRQMRAVLLSSVYLPAVMAVLAALSNGNGAQYADRRWHRIFTARAEHLSVNVESCDVLEASQRILNLPFDRLAAEFTARLD